ncbi:Growth arrest and DNA-damage-inducible proteins-interacting protein 1 [Caligus rogercresseyi]|uniref:Growth arrest and DNA-damage-inducible proteins-interacting protein 1 n=1 Tax=Caligus rogercresseyi TaxID=217165 RepID=A0A7T8KJB2_CALRO|nr:Growth arrest and DNA-damage-inducible proteins-interacting protein 1 [Caligus rogercresseyi]
MRTQGSKELEAVEREEAILKNIKDMDKSLQEWKNKVKMRNKAAEDARLRRLNVLKELRQEYGYDMDPNVTTHAEKIAQKEAEIIAKQKEVKKSKKKAKM